VSERATLVWFRNDLRLADHPALRAALEQPGPVIPVYILEEDPDNGWSPGAASRYWLYRSLAALGEQLESCGSRLLLRKGDPVKVIKKLAGETKARGIYWNRRYEPRAIERDTAVEAWANREELEARTFLGHLLFEPWEIENQQGKPFQVFTPFWKHCLRTPPPDKPLPAPRKIPPPKRWPRSLRLAALNLEPRVDWAGEIRQAWTPGARGAERQLERFLDGSIEDYPEARDRPDLPGTSRLSPHLHFGEISPRQLWHAVTARSKGKRSKRSEGAQAYLRQLGWREFAHHLLYHFPHTSERPLRPEFEKFPWRKDPRALRAWQKGQTGFPIVDAGMRQLWATGWMHNRVRMVVASFLVKDLLLSWVEGARWFWDTLVDADPANNTLGWQWVAGCGADAAPFFRIFNPVSQGEKFDPEGDYVRRWVPELARLPREYVHAPWTSPAEVLKQAGITIGKTYPEPLVNHAKARVEALKAYERIKRSKSR